jgi:site-specific recombinase XerC
LAQKALGDSEGIGTHTMRKSFATHLYLATHDIYCVKTLLGHAFVTTTENYIKYGLAMLDDTIDDLCLASHETHRSVLSAKVLN